MIQNAGLTPDHNDLTQLWQAIQSLIGQKYITTPITKRVHGSGADFADLHEAFNWLSQYVITQSGFVTFLIAPGRWTYTQTVEINHPNAVRVSIQGAALLGAAPQPPNMSVTGYHSATDGNNQIVYLRSVYATELSFTGGITGFMILRGGMTMRYLLLTGSQSITTPPPGVPSILGYGSGLEVYDRVILDGISIWGFGYAGIFMMNGAVESPTSLNCVCAYCNVGVESHGGFAWFAPGQTFIVVSNADSGMTLFGGWWYSAGPLYCAGNDSHSPGGYGAITLEAGADMWVNVATVQMNNSCGVVVEGSSNWVGESSLYESNTQFGFLSTGGTSYVVNSAFAGNGNIDIVCEAGWVLAIGASFASSSPAPNDYHYAGYIQS